ncbi:hypothetical protein CLU97_1051 [Chryseobacterium sp. 7]|uniref:hypothetical protein n=1 Tax=Chryseobacterium sp. 7 TaxID=2035214 RepID=UPI000F1D6B37|nr:hypothetical protein [Chryseobacterium sp. 7]RLJ31615.1 hypothetical protein CLU97_1051 [Chryseobacterium sp. 7]
MLTDKIEKSISENHRNILVRNFFGEEEYDIYHKIMFKAEASAAGSNITSVVDNGNGVSNESAFDGTICISSEYIHKEELHAGETANQIQIGTVKARGVDDSSVLKVIWNLKKW